MPEMGKRYEGSVDDFSNAGNPIIKPGMGAKRTVVMDRDNREIEIGDRISFTIEEENYDHYKAELLGHRSVTSGYDTPPNIPIHHDGQSVGSTRSESDASKSVEDRK
ncbi:hypothetical protein PNP85_13960 [Halobacterium salinarum]|uniref:Uncharacterized protein n=1 Tax=Halobacterium salinarum (strain ATCC 33171 / DSM 3754 / JCM 8978 / NBRC 102687 / NCIMB 764 / 91-R6) TaxID=2597657 RepID=A0A4D6GSY2_HALS9|nr:hypothetical protein [Halobacterium salinarum]MDL0137666.1 hypothetical protein [Halobacterium salinarum]MDL0140608.1 hypothetical protein [Halobacterium salinarum]QCC44783.1 uncharacterized protein HBSAL_05565 [Halobacterium salinarum]